MAVRQRSGPSDEVPELLVGRTHAALPVWTAGGLVMPELALVVRAGSGTVLAAGFSTSQDIGPAMSRALPTLPLAGIQRITLSAEDAASGTMLAIEHVAILSRFTVGRLLAKSIGRGVGTVKVIYRADAARQAEKLLRSSFDEPLSPDEAHVVITTALARHNEARHAAAPLLFRPDDQV